MINDDRNQSVELTEKPPREITVIDDITEGEVGDQTHNKNRVRYITCEEAATFAEEIRNTARETGEWREVLLQWKVQELFPTNTRMQESAILCILEHL